MQREMLTQDLWREDLAWLAQRGFELSETLCTCEGFYHNLWGALRLASVNNTMEGEDAMLASLLAPYIRDSARVMIGGSADTGVLCGIGRIFTPHLPSLTVVDKCRAPLALIGEFAAAKGLACRTLKRDLLDLDGSETWDQIILHYTPDFIGAPFLGRLFRTLKRSLAPGGIMVCAAMTGTTTSLDNRSDMEAAYFARSAIALKDTPMAELARTPGFERRLREYSACRTSRRLTLPTAEKLRDLLQGAGLQVLHNHATSRARRLLAGMDVVDTSSIIVANAG